MVSYTLQGKERWRHPLGPFQNFYGMAASLVVAGDLVVLGCDQQTGSFVIAVDRITGRHRWKTERAGMNIGWATPMLFRPVKGAAELIVLVKLKVNVCELPMRWQQSRPCKFHSPCAPINARLVLRSRDIQKACGFRLRLNSIIQLLLNRAFSPKV